MTIPDSKLLRKKCRKHKIKIANDPYFQEAEEIVNLQKTFLSSDFFGKAMLWIDMIIYPIYVLVRLCMQDFSPSYIFSLMKTYQLWIDWFRYQTLLSKVKVWIQTVRKVGGPWISCNDPEYHVFVYADGMTRLKKLPKKS